MLILKQINWIIYYIKWQFIKVIHVLFGKYYVSTLKYGEKRILSPLEGQIEVYNGIKSGKPFACCRFGFVEMGLVVRVQRDNIFRINSFKRGNEFSDIFNIRVSDNGSGIKKFAEMMQSSSEKADILCLWNNMEMSDYYVSQLKNVNRLKIASASSVEPYIFKEPWTRALENKKVLVINPFGETIKSQYEKYREKLFKDSDVLPEFQLITMDSVWYSQAGKDERFDTWFEALDYLFESAMKIDFDIALLGCGLFGFPLAVKIKESGRQAIHMGSASQILFGITGKRWEESGGLDKYVNEYWTKPPKDKAPTAAEKLDQGCYW